jgi:hypothetical protein
MGRRRRIADGDPLPTKVTVDVCQWCAARGLPCEKYDIPELGLSQLSWEVAARIALAWNDGNDLSLILRRIQGAMASRGNLSDKQVLSEIQSALMAGLGPAAEGSLYGRPLSEWLAVGRAMQEFDIHDADELRRRMIYLKGVIAMVAK